MRPEQYLSSKFGRPRVGVGATEAPYGVQVRGPGGGFKPKENRVVQGRRNGVGEQGTIPPPPLFPY